MPRGRWNPVERGAAPHGGFGMGQPRGTANARCQYCGRINCLVYRDGEFRCRNLKTCQSKREGWVPRQRTDIGVPDDGVLRIEDMYRDPNAMDAYNARRYGITVEQLREQRRRRQEAWDAEAKFQRERRLNKFEPVIEPSYDDWIEATPVPQPTVRDTRSLGEVQTDARS